MKDKDRDKSNSSGHRRLFSVGVLPKRNMAEVITSTVGSFVAIYLIYWVSSLVLKGYDLPLMVASMGAAGVLLYAAPRSTMSQPWPLFMGHLISAVVGVSCAKFIPDLALASAVAVSGAILAMHLTRSLHPPGGAAALVAVIGGDSIQVLGYLYVLVPVGLNVLIMFVAAMLINNVMPGTSYPMKPDDIDK